MRRLSAFVVAAVVGGSAVAATPARADECDDIVGALVKRMDQVRSARKEGDSRTTICARLGRVSGLTQAAGLVAEHCMDEGKKRDELIQSAAETEKALEVDNVCR